MAGCTTTLKLHGFCIWIASQLNLPRRNLPVFVLHDHVALHQLRSPKKRVRTKRRGWPKGKQTSLSNGREMVALQQSEFAEGCGQESRQLKQRTVHALS